MHWATSRVRPHCTVEQSIAAIDIDAGLFDVAAVKLACEVQNIYSTKRPSPSLLLSKMEALWLVSGLQCMWPFYGMSSSRVSRDVDDCLRAFSGARRWAMLIGLSACFRCSDVVPLRWSIVLVAFD